MTEMSKPFGKRFRDSLKNRKVQIVGLASAGVALAPNAMAANGTFDFTILNDLGTSLVGLIPTANSLVDQGAPLFIKICVVAAVCAPFVWLYHKSSGKK
jgi:hypothetical protein